jgi:RHS repeat-associated protein
VSGSDIEVYHADRLGSVRAITDASGTVTATYRTDESGIPTGTTGSSTQPFTYTGEPRDATGLVYLRARSYDPVLGRFMSRDTWAGTTSASQSLNRYAYVGNNPTSVTDPSGRCPWCAGAAVGGLIGGVAGLGGYLIGSIATGQSLDLGQAALATAGGAITGGVCGVTLGFACLAAGAATSVVQYQASPGATNPFDDPVPYAITAVSGAVLGRVTGGQVLRRAPVWWGADLVPNVVERFVRNYPGWSNAVRASFLKSLLASSGSSIAGGLLNPPSVAAASRTLKPQGTGSSWR